MGALFSMRKNEAGFTMLELFITLILLGSLFVFLINYINPASLNSKVKNAVIQSALTRTVLAVDGHIASYGQVPTETEFFSSLDLGSIEYDESCVPRLSSDFECLYKLDLKDLPKTCDLSAWRSDSDGENECFMRYYAGNALTSNSQGQENFRLYAKIFGENSFYVFDSSQSGVLFKCPSSINDFDNLKECYEL